MLPAKNQLKKKQDFGIVFQKGKGFKENFLYLKVVKNNLKTSRFGFIISKKFSPKATVRNKIKRRLREIVKINLDDIKKGIDGVLIVIPGLQISDFWELEEIVNRLFRKAGIVK